MADIRNPRRATPPKSNRAGRRDRAESPDGGYWFVQRRYGYGGVPVTWQGWLSIVAYLAVVGLSAWYLPSETLRFTAFGLGTLAFLAVLAKKTDGGLAWRWGRRNA